MKKRIQLAGYGLAGTFSAVLTMAPTAFANGYANG